MLICCSCGCKGIKNVIGRIRRCFNRREVLSRINIQEQDRDEARRPNVIANINARRAERQASPHVQAAVRNSLNTNLVQELIDNLEHLKYSDQIRKID